MSENETTTSTDTPEVPSNVVSFTPEVPSATEPSPQDATVVSETPAAEQPAEPKITSIQEAVAHVISNIDLSKVTHHDVVHDLFQNTQDFAFKLMLAAKLFEHMIIRDSTGLKGEAFDLLRHADETVTTEIHTILKAKVAVPVATEVVAPESATS
jgi:hypothetical protein